MTAQATAATGALPAPKLPDLLGHLRHWWPAWLLSAVLGFLVLYPLGMLFVASIRDPAGVFSVEAYARVFSSTSTYELIWTTIWLAAVRVVLASLIGVFLAWVVTRTDTPWRGGIETLVWIKFFAPPLPMTWPGRCSQVRAACSIRGWNSSGSRPNRCSTSTRTGASSGSPP
jgi:iron(III) transport system permease protein